MFMGEYNYTLDDKGRLTIPAKIREQLGHDFIVTRGLDKCLFVYPKEEWENVISKYKELPNTKNARNYLRFLFSGATSNEFDKQGRINIPLYLSSYATLLKEVVIVGVINRIEIWSKEKWEEFMNNNLDRLSDISENLFDSSLNL